MASSSCANSPSAYASYDVLVHQLAVLLGASSGPNLAVKPLPFASSYRLITTWFSTVIFLQGTYTPLVHAHDGRTQTARRESLRSPHSWTLMLVIKSLFRIYIERLLFLRKASIAIN